MAKTDHLNKLDNEIKRLQSRVKQLERDIDNKLDFFQDNYRSMAIKSFLPAFLAKTGIVGSVIEMLLENKKVHDTVNKLTSTLVDKLTDGVDFLSRKFSRKGDEPV